VLALMTMCWMLLSFIESMCWHLWPKVWKLNLGDRILSRVLERSSTELLTMRCSFACNFSLQIASEAPREWRVFLEVLISRLLQEELFNLPIRRFFALEVIFRQKFLRSKSRNLLWENSKSSSQARDRRLLTCTNWDVVKTIVTQRRLCSYSTRPNTKPSRFSLR
jgi:uncharacterized membrane protein